MTNSVLIPIFAKGNFLFTSSHLGKEGNIKEMAHGVLFSGKFIFPSHSPTGLDLILVPYIHT